MGIEPFFKGMIRDLILVKRKVCLSISCGYAMRSLAGIVESVVIIE